MCVGVAHDHVSAVGVDLAALIARHHSRGNSGSTQEQDECARVVLAESAPGIEQEAVDPVTLQQWRGQRIDEWLRAEIIEHGGDERAMRP